MRKKKKIEIDLKREISFIINTKIKDPRIGFVTVTDVELSPDYHWLNAFISIMGSAKEINDTLEVLKQCRGFIKKNLIGRLRLRNIPDINFIYDNSIDKGLKITEILGNLGKKRI